MTATDAPLPFADSVLPLLERKATEARSNRKALESELEEARRSESVWNCLVDAQKRGRSVEIVNIFQTESDRFKQLRNERDEAIPLLESLYKESEEKAKDIVRRFVTLFPKACDEAGIKLDSDCRHPDYSVFQGFVRIVVDEGNMKAKIAPRDSSPIPLLLDVDPLVERLQAEIKRLFGTKRDSQTFLAKLQKAYQAVLRDEKKPPGTELPLRRVANRLSKNLNHFRYDEFNIDLSNVVQSEKTLIKKTRLHLNHTRNTRQGMLLYGLEGGGYMGFISFKPEES